MYKAVIPCAGTGSRIKQELGSINKALFTLGDLPVIAHLINRIPAKVDLVIILGYQSEMVRNCCESLFPDRNITFVNVDKFEGEGSGLGRSLLAAREQLQCPFVFCPNDCFPEALDFAQTIDPSIVGNWVLGVEPNLIPETVRNEYRQLTSIDGELDFLWAKGEKGELAYSGLCGIKDHDAFWHALETTEDTTIGESAGLRALTNVAVFATAKWYDIGNPEMMGRARNEFQSLDFNILPKLDEAIWFQRNRVVKFFADPAYVTGRIARLEHMSNKLIPKNIEHNTYTYSYDFVNGDVLSSSVSSAKYLAVLNTMQSEMWRHTKEISATRKEEICKEFYIEKTWSRVASFYNTREMIDGPDFINGLECISVKDALAKVPWTKIQDSIVWGRFHGDFHAENILYEDPANNSPAKITIIDWRQDFARELQYGDVHYDLAKFLHGLIVSHASVHTEKYIARRVAGKYEINIDRSLALTDAERCFKAWVDRQGYDFQTIWLLTALIFINIAPLHHEDYDLFLMLLGRKMLQEFLLAEQEGELNG